MCGVLGVVPRARLKLSTFRVTLTYPQLVLTPLSLSAFILTLELEALDELVGAVEFTCGDVP